MAKGFAPRSSKNAGAFWFELDQTPLIKLQQLLDRLEGNMDEEVKESITEELYAVYDESQVLVPVDTGRLKASGAVTIKEYGPGQIIGQISYNTPYAARVHEDPFMRHKPPTRWKFVEEPWAARKGGMVKAVQQRVQRVLRNAR